MALPVRLLVMFDGAEFRRWRTEADNALDMARVGDRYNWRSFLAEQAAQLAVKALLHGLGIGPWGHDLVELGRAMAAALGEPLPAEVADALVRLSRLYIPTRYPDAHPAGDPGEHYSAADADKAIGDAELILASVDAIWRQLGDA
ncbi:MAG: HEPN domain-containing protein [Acidimicrobiales bacterium]